MIYKLHYQVLVFTMHGKEHKNQLKLIKSKKKGTRPHEKSELHDRLYFIAHAKKIYIIQRKTSKDSIFGTRNKLKIESRFKLNQRVFLSFSHHGSGNHLESLKKL